MALAKIPLARGTIGDKKTIEDAVCRGKWDPHHFPSACLHVNEVLAGQREITAARWRPRAPKQAPRAPMGLKVGGARRHCNRRSLPVWRKRLDAHGAKLIKLTNGPCPPLRELAQEPRRPRSLSPRHPCTWGPGHYGTIESRLKTTTFRQPHPRPRTCLETLLRRGQSTLIKLALAHRLTHYGLQIDQRPAFWHSQRPPCPIRSAFNDTRARWPPGLATVQARLNLALSWSSLAESRREASRHVSHRSQGQGAGGASGVTEREISSSVIRAHRAHHAWEKRSVEVRPPHRGACLLEGKGTNPWAIFWVFQRTLLLQGVACRHLPFPDDSVKHLLFLCLCPSLLSLSSFISFPPRWNDLNMLFRQCWSYR